MNIVIEQFIEDFSSQFEESELSNITPGVNFKSLETWDSLTAFSVQAMIQDNYKVAINSDDFKTVTSVEDLFNLVKSRL